MKRTVLTVTLVAVLSLALAACGGNNAATNADNGKQDAAGSAAKAADTALVKVDTEGMGVIAMAEEGEELKFDDDTPTQSSFTHVAIGKTLRLEARDYDEYEGWHFAKWTRDGKDYSTEKLIELEVDGDADYVAVFELTE